jgi:hypothetical protein
VPVRGMLLRYGRSQRRRRRPRKRDCTKDSRRGLVLQCHRYTAALDTEIDSSNSVVGLVLQQLLIACPLAVGGASDHAVGLVLQCMHIACFFAVVGASDQAAAFETEAETVRSAARGMLLCCRRCQRPRCRPLHGDCTGAFTAAALAAFAALIQTFALRAGGGANDHAAALDTEIDSNNRVVGQSATCCIDCSWHGFTVGGARDHAAGTGAEMVPRSLVSSWCCSACT